ncbi:hypothetical protein BDP27DRAFT_1417534 [Rhodocollybia butyracea]|uniref:Secreted protein n=1 Tax=Rhodocollybia butyracea TaxID=206335 RepID=A0A9P5Q3T3_9AGAR|nr:hypothetical protein BDP27DRAFT_1417534 [Rhodocollybia butyracea]
MQIPVATVLLAVLHMITSSAAQGFMAWSGDACDGDAGDAVDCINDCGSFSGRHSFKVTDPLGRNICTTFFVDAGCTGATFDFSDPPGLCVNVNTGTDIESFICGLC